MIEQLKGDLSLGHTVKVNRGDVFLLLQDRINKYLSVKFLWSLLSCDYFLHIFTPHNVVKPQFHHLCLASLMHTSWLARCCIYIYFVKREKTSLKCLILNLTLHSWRTNTRTSLNHDLKSINSTVSISFGETNQPAFTTSTCGTLSSIQIDCTYCSQWVFLHVFFFPAIYTLLKNI